MRRLRYQVACSLDGYIADSNGGFDWIIPEPTFDFNALFAQFDTLLMGRKTYAQSFARRSLCISASSLLRGPFGKSMIPKRSSMMG